ncbi:MAG: tetratricopeptide repeat protein [Candidatus Heimdallarchaeota archaeon]|nr:tetratricopeptide repeat protein [Candidatus Heimdallarchaeota archaeon]
MSFISRSEDVGSTTTEKEMHYPVWPKRCFGCAKLSYPGSDVSQYSFTKDEKFCTSSEVVDTRYEHFTDTSDGYTQTIKIDSVEKEYKEVRNQIEAYLCKKCLKKARTKLRLKRTIRFFIFTLIFGGLLTLTITVHIMFLVLLILSPFMACRLSYTYSGKYSYLAEIYFEIIQYHENDPIKYNFSNWIVAQSFKSLNPHRTVLYRGSSFEKPNFKDYPSLAIISHLRKDYSKAIEYFQLALKGYLKNDLATIICYLGWSHLFSGRNLLAMNYFQEAIELDNELFNQKLIVVLNKLLEKDISNIETYSKIGEIYYKNNLFDNAIIAFNMFLEQQEKIFEYRDFLDSHRSIAQVWYFLATIYLLKEDYQKAIACYKNANDFYPDIVPLAELYELRKRVENCKITTRGNISLVKSIVEKNDLLDIIDHLVQTITEGIN